MLYVFPFLCLCSSFYIISLIIENINWGESDPISEGAPSTSPSWEWLYGIKKMLLMRGYYSCEWCRDSRRLRTIVELFTLLECLSFNAMPQHIHKTQNYNDAFWCHVCLFVLLIGKCSYLRSDIVSKDWRKLSCSSVRIILIGKHIYICRCLFLKYISWRNILI